MKYERHVTVTARDINEAVSLQYGLNEGDIDVTELFWPGDYMNDCYKRLWIDEEAVNQERLDIDEGNDTEEVRQRLLILDYLHYVFPDEKVILVDVSW